MSDDIDTGKNQTTISTSDSNAMKQLFAAGIPVDEISKKLNLTKTMVTKTLKLDLCKKIEFLLSEGYPIRQISKMVGVCSPTISYWINSGENQALYIYFF